MAQPAPAPDLAAVAWVLLSAYAVFGIVACFIYPYRERAEYFWYRYAPDRSIRRSVLLAISIVIGWWWWMWGGGESISIGGVYDRFSASRAHEFLEGEIGAICYYFWKLVSMTIFAVVLLVGGLIGWVAFLVSFLYLLVSAVFIGYYFPWVFVIAYHGMYSLLVPDPGEAALKRAARTQNPNMHEEVYEAMVGAHRGRKKYRSVWNERREARRALALADRSEADTQYVNALRNIFLRSRG